MKSLILLVLAILVSRAHSILGLDLDPLTSLKDFKCIKQAGYKFIIARGFKPYGSVDTNSAQNLARIRQAGLKAEVYVSPCRGKKALAQVQDFLTAIDPALYDTIWVNIESNAYAGCSWYDYSYTSNCNYTVELLTELRASGKPVGVYSSFSNWKRIFGSNVACPQAAGQAPLWFAYYDNVANFTSYDQFGGWNKPTQKQYMDTIVCALEANKNYREKL